MDDFRIEKDSLGTVEVPADKLWGAQTQRALQLFDIGNDAMPREMIEAYGVLKMACALANHGADRLSGEARDLIVGVCEEILSGHHADMFPLSVWISGSGTQFNMNVNEVIANRCSQIAGKPLGSKEPVHPNDHVNRSQSTNDNFPSAMYMAAALGVSRDLIPVARIFAESLATHATAWEGVVKIGRTHMQDATPLTLGQEFSGYAGLIEDNVVRLEAALQDVFKLPLGGTAVGTGINAYPGFDKDAIGHIADLTGLPFVPAANKFTVQGSHDALIQLSGSLKTLASSLYKIACDIRLLACGPRAGLGELVLPANEPGSSIMPGKVNPTQCEALSMVAIQVMANDYAITLGGSGGILEMNVYKPLMIHNIMQSIRTMAGAMLSFKSHLLDGLTANTDRIKELVGRSLMLVTALSPAIGYEKAAKIAMHAHGSGSTLKEAALELGYVTEVEFDDLVVPEKMVRPQA
ncbi:class II fumarate hydratase [Pseudodesulfovibrio piezophilus]|uniref:Fumarate hydratase class II n=1 Tax=Pseudodesulfovibrio piezophilus (strain DSM 21447 / JCM 15486 / C1TLV30) TaxID=1322246 RepID=M1WX52_PSEP2|nr:class II fumarate hydratase [Pseudodesulfovibrio piezophilus]CCH49518.1 Fumarate hydratase class II 2 [Pseudodesulfovibrio piezophilus C1TLV30]